MVKEDVYGECLADLLRDGLGLSENEISKWIGNTKKGGGMFGAGTGFLLGGLGLLIIGIIINSVELKDRVYPNGNTQPLATVCQVEETVKEEIGKLPKPEEVKKYDGWFMDGKVRREANILEKAPGGKQIKVEYPIIWNDCSCGEDVPFIFDNKWLRIEDFHKNYSTEELSEMVRELQAKKKR
jgi:hypothetical protein